MSGRWPRDGRDQFWLAMPIASEAWKDRTVD